MDAVDVAGAISAVGYLAGVGGAPSNPAEVGEVSVGTEHGDWLPHGDRGLRGGAE